MSTDAIVLPREDHREIRSVFKRFESAGENADAEKSKAVGRMLELLSVHTYIENEVMYPEVRLLLPDLDTARRSPARTHPRPSQSKLRSQVDRTGRNANGPAW